MANPGNPNNTASLDNPNNTACLDSLNSMVSNLLNTVEYSEI
jgi:hypothetical protein